MRAATRPRLGPLSVAQPVEAAGLDDPAVTEPVHHARVVEHTLDHVAYWSAIVQAVLEAPGRYPFSVRTATLVAADPASEA
ncbi:hypothetical protein ABZW96_08765 [Nocardia sp. NPDC004168]|uniref:hypothetical protein n=1 Tax=Nocardia sp. NPDC004168 TaxID=3154452 RepID=UPI0033A59DF1